MEIVCIEETAFETWKAHFASFKDKVQDLCSKCNEKGMLAKWQDNQDVCKILRISPRTLQTLRDNKSLPYTQVGRKIYYKSEDVKNAVKGVEELENFRKQKQNKQTLKNCSHGTNNKE